MTLTKFHTAVAIGSLLAAGTAFAQAQKGEAETKSPPAQSAPANSGAAKQGQAQRGAETKSEPKRQTGSETSQGKSSQRSNDGKAKQAEGRDTNSNSRSQPNSKSEGKSKQAETNRNRDQNGSKDQRGKAASKDGSRDGRATETDRKTTTNGKSQPSAADRNQQSQSNQQPDRNRTAADQAKRPGNAERVQLSDQQRTQAKQAILQSRNVNRARQASFTINIGTRVPRNVRLAVLPAAVIAIVPQYRNYRYVTVDDRICIIEPSSYTIVEVLDEGSSVPSSGGMQEARLVLTPEEEQIVLQSVEIGGSTLGLGAITIGSPVPRNAQIIVFPEPVLGRISKLRSYEFVAADNRVAIVEPRTRNVVYIIERR